MAVSSALRAWSWVNSCSCCSVILPDGGGWWLVVGGWWLVYNTFNFFNIYHDIIKNLFRNFMVLEYFFRG